MVELASLFEPPPAVAGRTARAELAAVAAGRKPLAMFALRAPEVIAGQRDFAELAAMALARGLALLVQPAAAGSDAVRMFALRPEQAWRVAAMREAHGAAAEAGGWSDTAELLESRLLGYSLRERRAWVARARRQWAAWGARTVYALVDGAAAAAVRAAGQRSFAIDRALAVFAHRDGWPVAPAARVARRRAPAGMQLVRFALAPAFATPLLGAGGRGRVLRAEVSARKLPALNAALASRIEWLTARGWA